MLDQGLTAVVEDFVQMPASSASRPRARLNVLREVPDGSGRLFVNDLRGRFYAIDGATVHTYFDLASLRPEFKTGPGIATGFVSFAFHPEFATNGVFYTAHSEFVGSVPATMVPALPTTIVQHEVLSEWTAVDPAANSFSGTSRELIRIASPSPDHNLGEVAFNPNAAPGDPDYGLLYVGAGDYGQGESGGAAQLQRLDTPLGALLRIDPLGGSGAPYSYGIPAGNPFANDGDPTTLDEIYASGFRNAHRIAWDAGTAAPPFVSDIGQGNLDEVNALLSGANYGWPEREGTFALDVATDPETVFALPPNDASFGFAYPVAQYDHDEGRAIAGGFVYRAVASSPLYGKFIFGDIVTGRLFYADASEMLAADDGDPATTAPVYEITLLHQGSPTTLLARVRAALSNPTLNRIDLRWGMDLDGNLYVLTKQDGFVRRVIPSPGPSLPALHGAARIALAITILTATALLSRRGWKR